MNIQRLKHAWARGARIQFRWFDEWRDDRRGTFPTDGFLRIHPADAHLEYGPLSSALREAAIYGVDEDIIFRMTYQSGMNFVRALLPSTFVALNTTDAEHLGTFKLFVAEMLADEGL